MQVIYHHKIAIIDQPSWATIANHRDDELNIAPPATRHRNFPGDTVGAVALDAAQQVACGTSTGGIVGKRPGRATEQHGGGAVSTAQVVSQLGWQVL